jgi:thiol-disulfide isomerase/thioredoxin
MKGIIWNFVLLIALTIAISSFTGCGGSQNVNSNAVPPPNASPSAAPSIVSQEKPSSEYPQLAAAVAQADLKNMDGSTFKIADKKGKILLINLWATWCGPCLSEMPALVTMQQKYGDQGVEIIGLNTDDESEHMMSDVNEVIQKKGINYQVVFGDEKTQAAFLNISKFAGIPQSFIVDRDGSLRAVFKGANPENVKKMDGIIADLVSGNQNTAQTSDAPANPESSSDKKL